MPSILSWTKTRHWMVAPDFNSPPRILLVDDDVSWRTALTRLLTIDGYDICCADSGEEAISLFGRLPLALVITQLMLGGKDSFAIIPEMRRELVCARFIAIAREGWLPAVVCNRIARHLGAHCALIKPVHPADLQAAVRRAMEFTPDLYRSPSSNRATVNFGVENSHEFQEETFPSCPAGRGLAEPGH